MGTFQYHIVVSQMHELFVTLQWCPLAIMPCENACERRALSFCKCLIVLIDINDHSFQICYIKIH